MNPYTKPHASAADRVAHLRAKGLTVARPNVAARKIEQIGYERLRIYFLSRRDHQAPGRPFLPKTTYQHILRLYDCDAKLRNLCFDGVGQIEILLRNRVSEVLSARAGSHPYYDARLFAGSRAHNAALAKMIRVFDNSSDQLARHYRATYTSPSLPPIWVLKEFMAFGTSSRLYGALANPIREEIAKGLGVAALPVFDSWIPAFVDLRNACAHHDRIFNRRFQKQPGRYRKAGVPSGDPATLKALMECVDHVLSAANGAGGYTAKVAAMLRRYPEIQPAEVGY